MAVMKMTGAASRGTADWNQIDWHKVRQSVRRLQVRIAKAVRERRWGKVKALQRLLTHSFSGKALAVKRVTENRGKRTPGVDRIIWDTPGKCIGGLSSLKRRGYSPLPLRRVHILKPNGKLRPLGIPAMKDRAMQALHLLALEPVAETTADPNSYGFRPYRATRDAAAQCFNALNSQHAAGWILDADISGCFDEISKDWIITNIPTDKVVLRKWLDSGYMQDGAWYETKAGTPQGSPISPTIANMALDGMEAMLQAHYGPRRRNCRTKVRLIRYADDFVITGASKEVLEETKSMVETFLSERGLSLSAEKTRIVRIEDGFDFLGWTVRKYDGKLLIKPAKKNVAAFLRKVRAIIKNATGMTQEYLIAKLNPVIRGWAGYHCNQVAKETFCKANYLIWEQLWRWACRRHPNKPRQWVKDRYFARIGTRKWVFRAARKDRDGKWTSVQLLNAADVPIRRHRKIRADANPFDPAWDGYFALRRHQTSPRTDQLDPRPHSLLLIPELVALVAEGLAEA
jgi:RNA-directed DNA polymerase